MIIRVRDDTFTWNAQYELVCEIVSLSKADPITSALASLLYHPQPNYRSKPKQCDWASLNDACRFVRIGRRD